MAKQSTKGNRNHRSAAPSGRALLPTLGIIAALAVALCAAGAMLPKPETAALPVVIQHVMSSNPALCYSVEGSYYDWIELKNTSDAEIDLQGWRLTDTGDLRSAFTFQALPLAAGASTVVYCDSAPKDYAGSEVFTGFRLSGDGELLLLADPEQRLSAVEVPPMAKGEVYERSGETGEYAIVSFEQAVGLPPDTSGGAAFHPDSVYLSELMPMNRSILTDADGEFSDWIELYNGTSAPVNLENYALSDSDRTLRKWKFPAVTLNPGQYLLVFASGKDRRGQTGELHTNFRLSSHGETLRLTDPEGRVVSQIEYDSAHPDQSLTREAGGGLSGTEAPSPGSAMAAPVGLMSNAAGLYINEVCSGGTDGDWVEIANQGGMPIDLSGMGLSDDPAKPRRWQFPAGTNLAPGGFAVISCGEGRDEDSSLRANYHADFNLSTGETVCLSDAGGQLIDRLVITEAFEGSAGRVNGASQPQFFAQPTPGQPNSGVSYARVRQNLHFSPTPGVVKGSSVSVTITADPGAVIYYTTDGSLPTQSSNVYTGPITLTDTTCLRAISTPQTAAVHLPTAATYVFHPHSLRVICVSGEPGQLNGETGMLNTGAKDAEADAYVEIYDTDGAQLVSQPCYMAITGHNTRTKAAQKGFKLNARRAYGDNRFRAPLFSNRPYDAYKVLSVRASGQDYNRTHMLDSILASLMEGTGVMYQETEVCVLYVNGQYWGIYNLREHIDRHSVAQFMGWSDNRKVNIVRRTGEKATATAGKSDDYKAMVEWVKTTDLSQEQNLQTLRQQMIVESYLDYVAAQMYTCNQDLSNIRCFRSLTEDRRWRWIVFDFDLSFRLNAENYVDDWFEEKAGTITGQDTTLFRALMKNAGVRDYFLKRMAELLTTNFAPERVVAKIQARRELIKGEMPYNCQRWNWAYSDWEESVNEIIEYAKVRPKILVGYLADAFHLSDAERQSYFGQIQ